MSIAELNNQAIALLAGEGSKTEAIKTLKQAVETLRSPATSTPAQNSLEVCSSSSHRSEFLGRDSCLTYCLPLSKWTLQTHQYNNRLGDPPHPTVRSIDVRSQTQQNNANESSYHFLYQRVFVVSEEESSVNLKAAVVLYNLAFLNHLRGLEVPASSPKSTRMLVGAARLYALALDMIKKHCWEYGSRKALLPCLAIGNNLGDLYWQHLCDLDEARKCFSLVQAILRHTEGHFEVLVDSSLEENFDEDEYSLFLLNAVVRATGQIVVATAA